MLISFAGRIAAALCPVLTIPWREKYSTVTYLITVTNVTYHMTAVPMIQSYKLSCIKVM